MHAARSGQWPPVHGSDGPLPSRKEYAMIPLEEWLAVRGEHYATALDAHREAICRAVTERLVATYPMLCYDVSRPDAADFQQTVYDKTPRRFHRLIQVVLRLQSIVVIEREYRWGWPILQRYQIEQAHLISHVRWYFEASRKYAPLTRTDRRPFAQLEAATIRIVRTITQTTIDPTNNNGPFNRLGFSL